MNDVHIHILRVNLGRRRTSEIQVQVDDFIHEEKMFSLNIVVVAIDKRSLISLVVK